jgi:hypothetical protein
LAENKFATVDKNAKIIVTSFERSSDISFNGSIKTGTAETSIDGD